MIVPAVGNAGSFGVSFYGKKRKPRMTDEEHNRYIAWAFLANGIFQSVIVLFMFVILFAFLGAGASDPEFPAGFFAAVFGFALSINLVFLSPNFVAAYGLFKKRPWARIAGIVAAALSAMNVPLGTLAAVYSFWFFCGDQWRSVYPETSARDRDERPQLNSYNPSRWEGYTRDEEGAYIHRTPPPPDWR